MQELKNVIDKLLYGTMFSIKSLYYDWYKKGIVLVISRIDRKYYLNFLIKENTTYQELIEKIRNKLK